MKNETMKEEAEGKKRNPADIVGRPAFSDGSGFAVSLSAGRAVNRPATPNQTGTSLPAGIGRFAVVIPVYNHQDRVRSVVLEAVKTGWPVIVVDDGSTDGSFRRIRDIRGIRTIRHPMNRGKGAALMTGFLRASLLADWAVTLDADGQHDPADIERMIRAIPYAERVLITGRRQGMKDTAPWTSRFGRGFSNFWVWVTGGPLLSDTQTGFRIYPLPEAVHLGVRGRRYQFEVEVLVRARRKGLRIIEVPVRVDYQKKIGRISHFRPFTDFLRNSMTFTRLFFERFLFSPLFHRD